MFGQHVYQRLTGALDPAHLQPWSFYFTPIWAELRTAGTLLLTSAGALLMLAHTVRRRWVEGAVVLLWFVVPIGVISMGTSKLYHYAYPFLPPLALAGGYAVALGANWLHGWLARPAAAAGRRLRAPMVVLRALVVASVLLAAMPLTTYQATSVARVTRGTRCGTCATVCAHRRHHDGERTALTWRLDRGAGGAAARLPLLSEGPGSLAASRRRSRDDMRAPTGR